MCPSAPPQGAGTQSPQLPEQQDPAAPAAAQGVQAFRGRFAPLIATPAPTTEIRAGPAGAAALQGRAPTAPEFPVLPAGVPCAVPLEGEGDAPTLRRASPQPLSPPPSPSDGPRCLRARSPKRAQARGGGRGISVA